MPSSSASRFGILRTQIGARVQFSSPDWIGLANEGYFFVGMIFWIFCFSMSRYSIFLEGKLDTGHRKR